MHLWLQQQLRIRGKLMYFESHHLESCPLKIFAIWELEKEKAWPTCVSPRPNDGDLAALNAGMSERREAKIRDREEKNRLKKEKLALEAKLEFDVVEKERAFKLQEQNMKMQAEYFQFFKEQFSRRESDGNNNRGATSNEKGDK